MAKAKEEVLTPRTLGGLEVQTVAESPEFINALIYGNPGVGKTVLAGSADDVPELRPVLFIDVEGGTFSIRERYPDVEVVRVQSWADMSQLYNELYKMEHDYKTIVLDSLTEMQKFSMYNIMNQLVQENPDRDPEVPGMREWGKNIEQIRRLVRAFRDLPVNTVLTALAATDKDSKTGVIVTRPSLSGKLAMEVGGFVDIVGYMYAKVVDDDVLRLLLTSGTDRQVAKDRSDRLPAVMENPDMQTIYSHIFKQENTNES
jgi:phage nucleotide-binding protein